MQATTVSVWKGLDQHLMSCLINHERVRLGRARHNQDSDEVVLRSMFFGYSGEVGMKEQQFLELIILQTPPPFAKRTSKARRF
ncbi:hypothetical protein NDU88_004429 [Pleurodeles waltl]|uniref:Uncharacterized protein n=1 Tax=Pleurodeles waltl TaxID=8319 RepID=A0AAV7TRG0_PLEWA|nr:hypothetical protein NDU88_004429 [Pleurodeles waltl]